MKRVCQWTAVAAILFLLPAIVAAETIVTATFADGKGTSSASVSDVVDAYRGMAGEGWADGWLQLRSGTAAVWTHTVLGPGDSGYSELVDENYLRYQIYANGTTPNAAIGRDYTGPYGIDSTKDHTLQFTMRIEEDLTNTTEFLGQTSARYQIHDAAFAAGQASGLSYGSTRSTWGIDLRGGYKVDEDTTFPDGYWAILGSEGRTDTGILAVRNVEYTFTLDFHPSAQTFDVKIVGSDATSFTGTGYGLAPTATGGTGPTGWLDFYTYQTKMGSGVYRKFGLDDIEITGIAIPEPTALAMALGILLTSLVWRRRG